MADSTVYMRYICLFISQVNLIGDKVVDPLIHNCEKCSLPILIYGRMVNNIFKLQNNLNILLMQRYENLVVGSVFCFFQTKKRSFGFQKNKIHVSFFGKRKRKSV